MSSIWRVVKRMLASILPWAPRSARKAAITEAARERDVARDKTRHAERTAEQIRRIAYHDNNFAASIIATLRNQERGGGDSGPARR